MAVFYFLTDAVGLGISSKLELTSIADARKMALQTAGELIRELPPSFWADGDWTMTVGDERGLTLFTVSFIAQEAPATSWATQ